MAHAAYSGATAPNEDGASGKGAASQTLEPQQRLAYSRLTTGSQALRTST